MPIRDNTRCRASVDQLIRVISLPSVSSLSDLSSLSFPTSSYTSDPDYSLEEFTDALATVGENDCTNEQESESSIDVEVECVENSDSKSEFENEIPILNLEKPIKFDDVPKIGRRDRHDITAAIGGLSFWPAYLALLKKKARQPKQRSKENKIANILSDEIPRDVNKIFLSLEDNVLNETFNERLNKMIKEEFESSIGKRKQKSKIIKSRDVTDRVEVVYPKSKLKSISLQFDPNDHRNSIRINGNEYRKIKRSDLESNSNPNQSQPKERMLIEMDLIKVLTKLIKAYKRKLNGHDEKLKSKCSIQTDKFDVFNLTDRSNKTVSRNLNPKQTFFPSFDASSSKDVKDFSLNGLVNSGVKYHVIELANAPLLPKSLLEALRISNNSAKLYLDVESYGDSGFGRVKLSSNVGVYKITLLDDNVDHFGVNNLNVDNWRLTSTKVLDDSFKDIARSTGNDWMSRNYGFNYLGIRDLNDSPISKSDSLSSSGNNCVMVAVQYKDCLSRVGDQISLVGKNSINTILTVLPNINGDCHDFITIPEVKIDRSDAIRNRMIKHGLIFELAQKLSKDKLEESDTYVHIVQPETKQYLCLSRLTGHIQFRRINFTSFNFTHSPRSGKMVEWVPACFKLLPLYKYTPSPILSNPEPIIKDFDLSCMKYSPDVFDLLKSKEKSKVSLKSNSVKLPNFNNKTNADSFKLIRPSEKFMRTVIKSEQVPKSEEIVKSELVKSEIVKSEEAFQELKCVIESPRSGNGIECEDPSLEISNLQVNSDDEQQVKKNGCCAFDMFNSRNNTRDCNLNRNKKVENVNVENECVNERIKGVFPIKGVADITITRLGVSKGGKKITGDCGVSISLSSAKEIAKILSNV